MVGPRRQKKQKRVNEHFEQYHSVYNSKMHSYFKRHEQLVYEEDKCSKRYGSNIKSRRISEVKKD
jgi:hypothetical protein